jgi:hypothetical protein
MTGLEVLIERYKEESEYEGDEEIERMLECFFDVLDEGAYVEVEGRGGFKKIDGRIKYFAPGERPEYLPIGAREQDSGGYWGRSFSDMQNEVIQKMAEEEKGVVFCSCGKKIRINVDD